jgi:hypothetical protein
MSYVNVKDGMHRDGYFLARSSLWHVTPSGSGDREKKALSIAKAWASKLDARTMVDQEPMGVVVSREVSTGKDRRIDLPVPNVPHKRLP